MRKPDISVIVTSYNDAEFLPICLAALLEQTWENIEIIGVNDASTDDTLKILKEYAKKDKRVKIVNNPENMGLASSRNRGLEKVTAPFVMFCDADDFYEPTTCEDMYKAINENKTDLAICEIKVSYKAHKEMKVSDDNYYALKFDGKQQINSNLIFNTDLSATNKIFRKSKLDEYRIRFPDGLRFEDAYFCVAYFCTSKTVYYVNKSLYNYVRRAGSIMSQTWSDKVKNDHAIDHLYIAFRLYDFLDKHKLLDRFNNLFWGLFGNFEDFAIRNSKSKERVKLVRIEAKDFINKHAESFAEAETPEQEIVRRLNSNGGVYVSSARIKRFLLKLMPTYKLGIDNIHRLRALRHKTKELISKLKD